jgi:hypothetical protein
MNTCALDIATGAHEHHLHLSHAELEVLRRAVETALGRAAGDTQGGLSDPTAAAAVAFFSHYKELCSRELIPFRGNGTVPLPEQDVHALFQAVALLLQEEGGEKGRRRGHLPATTLLAKLSRGST